MFLVGYEYELVDSSGNFPKELPLQDRNDIQQVRRAPMIFLRGLTFQLVEATGRPLLSEIQAGGRLEGSIPGAAFFERQGFRFSLGISS